MIKVSQQSGVYLIFILALLVCCQVIYIQHGWITVDSILYFEMARHLAAGDIHAAYQVEGFSWGFYPALIAVVHVLTTLSLLHAAQLLMVCFFACLVVGLMQLIKLAGGHQKQQIIGVCLLLGARYIVGDVLPMASRDLGYWAMMLLAVNQLILYYQTQQTKHAVYWQLLAIVAMLFRIEGAVQLLLLPLTGWMMGMQRSSNRRFNKLLPYAIVILLSLGAMIGLLFNQWGMEHLGRVRELITGFADIKANVTQNLTQRVSVMRDAVIGEPFKDFAWFTFLLSYFSIATIKSLTVAGWAPALLAGWGRKSLAKQVNPVAFKVLSFWLVISWIIGCLITFKVNLLSARYVALCGLVLIVFSSFVLQKMLADWQAKQLSVTAKLLLIVSVLVVLIGVLGSVKPKDASFYYEMAAVDYVESQRKLHPLSVIYTSPRQRFYANALYEGRVIDDWQYLLDRIQDGRLDKADYLVVRMDEKPENADKALFLKAHLSGFQLKKTFYGYKKKQRILVYQRVS